LGISELVRTEEILVGDDIVAELSGPGEIRVHAQVAVRIDGFELDAGILASLILESVQDQGGTELSLIDLVPRHFQIDVDAELQLRQHLLHDADVVHVRALGLHWVIGRRSRRRLHRGAGRRQRGRTAGEQGGIGRCRNHLRRRRKVAGKACVEGRAVDWAIGEADARTELVGIDVLPHLVEAGSGIQCQPVRELPFVRNIDAGEPAKQHVGIDCRERDVRQDLCASRTVDRQQLVRARDRGLFHARKESGAQRVRLVEAKRAVALDTVGDAAAIHVARHPIVHEVADQVGRELNGARAREIGELEVDVVDRFLQRKHPELVSLDLILIDLRRGKVGNAKGGEARKLSGNIRDLKLVGRRAANEAQSRGRIDQRGYIRKAAILTGAIMHGVEERSGIRNPQNVLQEPASEEILRAAGLAAVLDAVIARLSAAAVKTNLAAVVKARGLDVDNAHRAHSVLGRQRSGDQTQASDKAGVEKLAESAERLWQQDAVDAESQGAFQVLVANMKVALIRGILRDAGELQQRLLERGIAARRQRLNVLAGPGGGHRADRREDMVAMLIEYLCWRGMRGRGSRSGRGRGRRRSGSRWQRRRSRRAFG